MGEGGPATDAGDRLGGQAVPRELADHGRAATPPVGHPERRPNPPLHHQNRLRHTDYLALYDAAGFDVVHEEQIQSASDRDIIKGLSLATASRGRSVEALAVRGAHVVLRPRRSDRA